MLSAFTARPIIELRQRDKSRIETILAHGMLGWTSAPLFLDLEIFVSVTYN